MTLLVVTAVPAEADAVRAGLPDDPGPCRSPSPPSASAQPRPPPGPPGCWRSPRPPATAHVGVVSAGIGGGFAGRAGPGAIVLGTRSVAADLGAESPDGFLPLDELGFGPSS